MFHTHVSSVSSIFRRMLQLLLLDVLKVDQVLHLALRFRLPRLSVSSSQRWLSIRRPRPPPLLDASDVRCNMGPMWAREMVCRRGRPGASKPDCQSEPTRNLLELKIHTFIRPNLYVIFCFSGYITFIIYLDILYI